MKRFIAQFHKGGFPELYHVAEHTGEGWIRVGEPKPYHEALEEVRALNKEPEPYAEPVNVYSGWTGAFSTTP